MINLSMIRTQIKPGAFFGVHAVSDAVAMSYARLMRAGRSFPPVVVVRYDERVMPLDGHHRLTACKINGMPCDAWEMDGDQFEELCERFRTAGRGDPDMMLILMADAME